MPKSEQEQRDLDDLQVALNREARSAMEDTRHLERLSPDDLKARGYKTMPDAVVGTLRFYRERMDKLIKAHLKKYHD